MGKPIGRRSSAPTLGCPLPSGWPPMMAAAGSAVITASASAAMKTYRRNFMCPPSDVPIGKAGRARLVGRGRLLDRCKDAASAGAANLAAAIDRRAVTSIGLAADPLGLAFPCGPAGRDNPGMMGGRVTSPTLVGRVEELGVLEAAQGRAANGEPAVVLVGGEAGIGKTRLVAELADRHRVEGRGCWWAAASPPAATACRTGRSWRRCGPCPPSSGWEPARTGRAVVVRACP